MGTVSAEWVIVNSIPADAAISVNSKAAGHTPLRIEGKVGEIINISVSTDLYETFSINYEFTQNKSIFIDLAENQEIDEDTYWQRKTAEVLPVEEEMPAPEEQEPSAEADEPLAEADEGMIRLVQLPPKSPAVLLNVPELDRLPSVFDADVSKGDIILDLRIRNNGTVKTVGFMTEIENKELSSYLEAWVEKWQFEPATDAGNPVAGDLKVKIEYDLESGVFSLPTYELVVTAEKQIASIEIEPTPTMIEKSIPMDEAIYYSSSEVSRVATVFSPPSLGNIPVEIINLNLKGTAEYGIFIKPEGEVARVEVIQGTASDKLDEYIIGMIEKSFWESAKKDGVSVGFTRKITVEYNTSAIKFTFTDL